MGSKVYAENFLDSQIPYNYFYLGNSMFVKIGEQFGEIKVFICNYKLNNDNVYHHVRNCLTFPACLWYNFTQQMNFDHCIVFPEQLFVFKKNNMYYIQRMVLKQDNYHCFMDGRCFLNESQWNILKENCLKTYECIIFEKYGRQFTEMSKLKGSLRQDYLEEVCLLFTKYITKELNKLSTLQDKTQLWNQYFFPAAFRIDIRKMVLEFWKEHQVAVDTEAYVTQIFKNVFLSFNK